MLVSYRRGTEESCTYKKTDNGWGEEEGNIELIGLQRLAAYAGEATKRLLLRQEQCQYLSSHFTRGTSKPRCYVGSSDGERKKDRGMDG
jgi:hypothetical protein